MTYSTVFTISQTCTDVAFHYKAVYTTGGNSLDHGISFNNVTGIFTVYTTSTSDVGSYPVTVTATLLNGQ